MSFDRMLTYDRSRAGWESIAGVLADGDWHSSSDLAMQLASTTDLQAETASSIIRDAVKAGYLRRRRHRNRVRYQVTAKGLDERPELRLR